MNDKCSTPLEQPGLDAASFELQRHFGREGSIYGIKACEEIARIAVVAYQRSARSESGATQPQCAGPFVDARDCPVHRKDVIGSSRSATGLSALERFALSILESHRNDGYPGDIDGGFVQEEAVRCGVLVEKEVNGPCNSETCFCAEVAEFPTTCYFLSDEVEAKRDALAAIDSSANSKEKP